MDHLQGHYIPIFASEIYDQNAELIKLGMDPVNLTSVILGTTSPSGSIIFLIGLRKSEWLDKLASVCVPSSELDGLANKVFFR